MLLFVSQQQLSKIMRACSEQKCCSCVVLVTGTDHQISPNNSVPNNSNTTAAAAATLLHSCCAAAPVPRHQEQGVTYPRRSGVLKNTKSHTTRVRKQRTHTPPENNQHSASRAAIPSSDGSAAARAREAPSVRRSRGSQFEHLMSIISSSTSTSSRQRSSSSSAEAAAQKQQYVAL